MLNSSAEILKRTKEIEPWMIEIRRRLHQTPELLYELHETSKLVAAELDKLGVRYETGIAETGIVATIGDDESRCIALRADMDALPIHEEADVEFRSNTDGKMHACGHDCHTAMLLGAAKLLKESEADLKGTVKLFFQPAEEGGAGAEQMCKAGAMENPKVEKVLALHVWPMVETGKLTGRPGPFLAATSSFEITVTGRGGHAAMPHLTIDPLTTGSKIVLEAQTLVSREQDPLEACVISFTGFDTGGSGYNVIPKEVVLRGTIRSLSRENKDALKVRLGEVATGIATLNKCTAKVEFPAVDYPATSNDPELWEEVFDLGESLVGTGNILLSAPVMGGEDFAFYGDFAPTCFIPIGTRNEAEGCTFGLHHPKFKVDESAFHIGAALHVGFATQNLS
ncbi:MAG: amidohydrolase [Verrucomicrobiales bacterium]|jgi:amidohydrolase